MVPNILKLASFWSISLNYQIDLDNSEALQKRSIHFIIFFCGFVDIIPKFEDAQYKRKDHLIKLSYSSDEKFNLL